MVLSTAAAAVTAEELPLQPWVLSVSSGKGGVGKTNTVINLALELQRAGRRVLVFDADLGLSSVPVTLGLSTDRDLSHVLLGEMTLQDVLLPGPEGISILPAGVGIHELTRLTHEQQMKLVCQTEQMQHGFDMVLVDTGSGISADVIFFNLVCPHNIIVVYPEPSAMADAYALMKVLSVRHRRKRFFILLNGVRTQREAVEVYDRLSRTCERLLQVSTSYCGAIPFDECIRRAVRDRRAVVQAYPQAASSTEFRALAGRLLAMAPSGEPADSVRLFRTPPHAPDACRSRSG